MNIKEHLEQLKQQRNEISFALLAERVPTSEDSPYRINKAAPIKPDEPLVLVLGGTGTEGMDNIRGYNGYLKQTDEFIKSCPELKDKGVRVCVAVCNMGEYHDDDIARHAKLFQYADTKVYNEMIGDRDGEYREELLNPAYIQDIFNEAVLPRISANDGKVRLPVAQALRNVRKLNMVTHCHGSYVAFCLEEMMQDKMQKLGYTPKEMQQIQSEMMVLNYAQDCPWWAAKSRFIKFESAADDHSKYQSPYKEWLQMTRKRFSLSYTGNSFMCGQIDKAGIEGNPPRVYIARKINGDYLAEISKAHQKAKEDDYKEPEEEKTINEHDFIGFKPKINMSKAALKLQKFFRNVLKNSVINSVSQPKEGFAPLPPTFALATENKKDFLELIKGRLTKIKLEHQFMFRNRQKLQAYMAYHQNNRIQL